MTRGKGYKPDPAGHRKTPFSRLLANRSGSLTAPLPSTCLDLGDATPAPFDQGGSGSCVPHVLSRAIKTRFNVTADALTWIPSMRGIYDAARCIDRAGDHVPLADDGCQPNSATRGVAEWGISPMGSRPSDGRFSDVDLATINSEPSFLDLQEEARTIILGTYAIFSTGPQREQEIKYALFNGFPIGVAVDASSGSPLQNYGGGVIDDMGEQLDHYVTALCYRTVDGQLQLGCMNSWGADWGERGMFWLAATAIQQLGDLNVFDIRKVVSP